MFSILYKPLATTDCSLVQYFAVLLIAMMGAAVTTLMPLIVGALSDSGLFSEFEVGLLTAADVAGILLASVSAFWWVRRCPWQRTVVLSTLLFILVNVLSSLSSDFYSLLLLRFIAGVACGISYAIALAALGDQQNADQAFAAMVTIQVIFGTLGFGVLPAVVQQFSYAGIYQAFNLCLVLALVLSLLAFPANRKIAERFSVQLEGRYAAALLVFTAVVLYYFAQGTVWAYLERIGQDAGLSLVDIGYILGLGFAISAIGSALSGWVVRLTGRAVAIWLTVVVQLPCLLALYLMTPPDTWLIYAVATILYQIFWSFIVPIMMAIFNDVDPSGRFIVFCVSAFKVGLVLGPPLAALAISQSSLIIVLPIGAVAIVLSAVCLHLAQRRISAVSQ